MLIRERDATIKAIEDLSRDYIISLRKISESENPAKSAYLAAYGLVNSLGVFVGGEEGEECENKNLRPDGFIDNLSNLAKSKIRVSRDAWFSWKRDACLVAYAVLESGATLLEAVAESGLTQDFACRSRAKWSMDQIDDKEIQDKVVQSRLHGNREPHICRELSLNIVVVGDILYVKRFCDIVKEVTRDGRQG